ncbi:unnamed protein product [Soboliphyme baturini]|uniref:Calpain catalytic domain-containing protein n=1 Tax=Soboliphyme baturini TaxID=241478 RepID=A0A183ISL2_9BILA|nr:unnamed protein product [Soboliphyme baturini]
MPHPKFVDSGFSRFDANQGLLGDCWFVAAVANLTLHEDLLFRVVPLEQGFEGDYCGIFYFHVNKLYKFGIRQNMFWQYGEWIDVCIDDRLPTIDGELVFMHSTQKAEFWPSLLEKAYAKLCGCYENLHFGTGAEAMEDLTGGIVEIFDLRMFGPTAGLQFSDGHENQEPGELILPNGLVQRHEFGITDVKTLKLSSYWYNVPREVELLRIRNPYGDEVEWKGAWSDGSSQWELVSENAKYELGLKFAADGEFWMSFEDVKLHFHSLMICHACNPDHTCRSSRNVQSCDELCKNWKLFTFHGAWVRGKSAGGCPEDLNSFVINPQYQFEISEDLNHGTEKPSNCIIALMQKYRRLESSSPTFRYYHIGFLVYKVDEPSLFDHVLKVDFFRNRRPVSKHFGFENTREVYQRLCLEKGRYVVVPCTIEKDLNCKFLLRIYANKLYAK